MPMRSLRTHVHLALLLSLAAVGCGGDDLVLPDAPGTVQIVDGNGQEGRSGDVLADPLVVRLVNEAGEGIPEQTVRWVPRSGSGTTDPATGTTDSDGFASAEWTLGPATGLQRLDAEAPGLGSVTFSATNTGRRRDPPAARIEPIEGDGQSAPAGTEVPRDSSRGPDTRRGRGAGGGLRRHLRRHRRRW